MRLDDDLAVNKLALISSDEVINIMRFQMEDAIIRPKIIFLKIGLIETQR